MHMIWYDNYSKWKTSCSDHCAPGIYSPIFCFCNCGRFYKVLIPPMCLGSILWIDLVIANPIPVPKNLKTSTYVMLKASTCLNSAINPIHYKKSTELFHLLYKNLLKVENDRPISISFRHEGRTKLEKLPKSFRKATLWVPESC